MEELMNNENLWHLQELIFDNLDCDSVMKCRRVCKSWNTTLKKMSDVKFLQEFGDIDCEYHRRKFEKEKVSTIIPGWKMAVKKYAAKASIDDLEEVKNSLRKLLWKTPGRVNSLRKLPRRTLGRVYCNGHPVYEAAKFGAVKLMEIIFNTSFDMNDRLYIYGIPLFSLACGYGSTEIVRMMILCSKEKNIDLNARGRMPRGFTGLQMACIRGRTETVQVLLKNWREFGIDIKAKNGNNETALDIIKYDKYDDLTHDERHVQIKKMLEDEYAQIDVTESH